jgi:hypothetical protein
MSFLTARSRKSRRGTGRGAVNRLRTNPNPNDAFHRFPATLLSNIRRNQVHVVIVLAVLGRTEHAIGGRRHY